MGEETGKTFPFQLKLYQNRLPEVIINESIGADHKLFPSLETLMQKFPAVFLELKVPGVITAEAKNSFVKLETPDKLIVIVESPGQVPVDLSPIAVLPTFQSGLLRLKHKAGVEAAAKQVAALPQMKTPVFEYLELLKNEKLSFQDIAKAFEENLVFSNQILDSINSFEKFISNPFSSLSKAIPFVGVEGIRHILIEKAFVILTKIFPNQRDKLCHLRRCQVLAGLLGNILDSSNPHLYWRIRSAALMHDIGSLLLAYYNSNEYERCFNLSRTKKIPICDIENLILGYNHQEAGLLMAEIIHLPEYLLPSIGSHHKRGIDSSDAMLLSTIISNGYINSESDKIGYTEYDECLSLLEEAKEAAEQEKRKKELAKRLSKLPIDDLEGRKIVEENFYKQFEDENQEEQIEGFKDHSKPNSFDIIHIETLFKEKLASVLKDGYENPLL